MSKETIIIRIDEEEVKQKLDFLMDSIRNYLRTLKKLRNESSLDIIFNAVRQFHRMIGEAFATVSFLNKADNKNYKLNKKIEEALREIEDSLVKVYELEKEFVSNIRKR